MADKNDDKSKSNEDKRTEGEKRRETNEWQIEHLKRRHGH